MTDESQSAIYDFGGYSQLSPPADRPVASFVSADVATNDEHEALRQQVHARLLELVRPEEINKLTTDQRRSEVQSAVETIVDAENPLLNNAERKRLCEDVIDEVLGLGPLEKLLRDPSVGDILVNGPRQIYVEREGHLHEVAVHFRDETHLLEIIRRILSHVGRRVDDASPIVDARLADGSRVNAIIPPLSLRGPSLSIRRFRKNAFRLEDLLRNHSLTSEMAHVLECAVRARLNIVVSGGTGSGKTTLLNALSAFIPDGERIVTIEDAAELQLQQRHVVQLEARPPNIEGAGAITIRDLMRNSLRMRPNRILIGECRGQEVLDMLQAMNTGHEGSLTTLHANSPRDALGRLEMMLALTAAELPLRAMREQMVSAIDLIVQVDRLFDGTRKVTSVTEVVDIEKQTILTQEVFKFHQLGVNEVDGVVGQFEATGIWPKFMERFEAAGIKLPEDTFDQRVLPNA